MNFQTISYVAFVFGYIQQSIISSMVNRLLVQSLLPLFQMKLAERKRGNSNVKLNADEVKIIINKFIY